MNHYKVITCKTYHKRHARIFEQHSNLAKYFYWPQFILNYDISDGLPFACSNYKPSFWEEHISFAKSLHLLNMQKNYHIDDSFVVDFGQNLSSFSGFEPRQLTQAEHSLLHKQYECLKLIANDPKISSCLILEDDASIEQIHSESISKCLSSLNQEIGFINFTGIGNNFFDSKIMSNICKIKLIKLRKAQIFTTCGFGVTSSVAKLLVDNFFPYALPVDFHIQHLLFKFGVKGYTSLEPVIMNRSLFGEEASSIQS